MSEQMNYSVNKSGWPDGPWMAEPDRVQWQHAGYACLIVRHSRHGNLCGYVGIDKQHPYYRLGYDDCDYVRVHGGLSYSGKCNGHICHIPEPGMPADVWWLGFDCAHGGDLVPGLLSYGDVEGDEYRDITYVKREVEQLAEQLRNMCQVEAAHG